MNDLNLDTEKFTTETNDENLNGLEDSVINLTDSITGNN